MEGEKRELSLVVCEFIGDVIDPSLCDMHSTYVMTLIVPCDKEEDKEEESQELGGALV